jgi:hypothetical protein
MRTLTAGLAAAVSVVVSVSATAAAEPSHAPQTTSSAASRALPGTECPTFPADNYWHARVDALPVNPLSAQWMSTMHAASTRLHPDFGPSFGAQSVPYGIPITVVRGAPRVPVTFGYADESDRVAYPLGQQTLIEGGSEATGDRHAIVVDADTCTLFETWDTHHTPSGWTAGSGATWSLRSNRLRPRGWTSADAAGLPILPGLLRWDEVKAGRVDHAIRFTTDVTRRAFIWPARHQAGSTDDASAPPMGARFRLRADFPLTGYSPSAEVVLRAMKEYGLVLADNGSPWYFQGTADTGWPAALIEQLKRIPASALEAVDTAALRIRAGSAQTRVRVGDG